MAYRYTRSENGTIKKGKVRFVLRGDLMQPCLHYEPSATAAYDVKKVYSSRHLRHRRSQILPTLPYLNHISVHK